MTLAAIEKPTFAPMAWDGSVRVKAALGEFVLQCGDVAIKVIRAAAASFTNDAASN